MMYGIEGILLCKTDGVIMLQSMDRVLDGKVILLCKEVIVGETGTASVSCLLMKALLAEDREQYPSFRFLNYMISLAFIL